MGKAILEPPGDLAEEDWQQLERVLGRTRYLQPVTVLRGAKNEPTAAEKVLPSAIENQGETRINEYLRVRDVAFRLTRIGHHAGGNRHLRELAFVPWDKPSRRKRGIRPLPKE